MKSFKPNQITIFLITRYSGFVLMFIRGLVIAKFLGTFYFGIWGFLSLVLQYLSYSSLGANFAITVQLSTDSQIDAEKKGRLANTAIVATVILSLILILLGPAARWLGIELFPRFDFARYMIVILLIAGTTNIQQVVINILRCEKRTTIIAINEIITSVLLLAAVFFFRDEKLIETQLIVTLLTDILSLVLFAFRYPYRLGFQFDWEQIKSLFKLGFPLFIFNFSYYLIPISMRSIISAFYPIEILGFYTLGNSIAFAALLGLQTIGWVIYPDVLSLLSTSTDIETSRNSLSRINSLYNTICFFLVFCLILFLPVVLLFLPQYRPALPVITIMVISQAIMSSSFGFNTLAVSRNQQNQIAIIGIEVVTLITVLGIGVSFLHYDQLWISVILLFGSILYTYLQVKLGLKLLNVKTNALVDFAKLYPINTIAAILLAIVGSFTDYSVICSTAACSIFFIINKSSILDALKHLVKDFNQ